MLQKQRCQLLLYQLNAQQHMFHKQREREYPIPSSSKNKEIETSNLNVAEALSTGKCWIYNCIKLDLLYSVDDSLAPVSIASHTVLRADQLNGNMEFFDLSEPVLSLGICV